MVLFFTSRTQFSLPHSLLLLAFFPPPPLPPSPHPPSPPGRRESQRTEIWTWLVVVAIDGGFMSTGRLGGFDGEERGPGHSR